MPTYTMEQYTALSEAYALGATTVSYGGKTVNYRSLEEMRNLLIEMEQALGLTPKKKTRVYPIFDNGLHD